VGVIGETFGHNRTDDLWVSDLFKWVELQASVVVYINVLRFGADRGFLC